MIMEIELKKILYTLYKNEINPDDAESEIIRMLNEEYILVEKKASSNCGELEDVEFD